MTRFPAAVSESKELYEYEDAIVLYRKATTAYNTLK
jgi:hypothetical protein